MIEAMVALGALITGSVGVWTWTRRRHARKTQSTLATVAHQLKLRGSVERGIFRGKIRGIPVTLTVGDVVEVSALSGVAGQVNLEPAQGSSPPSLQLGDPRFDAAVCSHGSETQLRAFLTYAHRKLVIDALQAGVSVHAGLAVFKGKINSPKQLKTGIMHAVRIAKALKKTVKAQRTTLQYIALNDPLEAVAIAAFEALESRSQRSVNRRFLVKARAQGCVTVQIAAATALDHGWDVMLAIVQDPKVSAESQTKAGRLLLRWASAKNLVTLLPLWSALPALGMPFLNAVELLGCDDALRAVLAIHPDTAVQVRGVEFLAQSPLLMEPLCTLLKDSDDTLALAVIAVLRAHGSVAAVPALRARISPVQFFTSAPVRAAANAAIQAIQGDINPLIGGLAVADDDAGALSVMPIEVERLSDPH